ncbi:hypothetical protein HB991_12085 [Yersinia mollaretii]|uniref:Rhs family protein n=1 Tax=Yersinia mollaretii TaxID=33060 RepID=A0AA44I0C4_YERMO|nr:hypothetical protein [Yersinia mollaretii]NIL23247.1 hypothetical protein [Yersinia mollaretii]CNJ36181.1 rhs family protein [Yersinia mollaretii]CNK84773.1 rhs family protein [Yersinia enterocolitica]CQQ89591.1 rhs family protein [Yersinia mollaretii]
MNNKNSDSLHASNDRVQEFEINKDINGNILSKSESVYGPNGIIKYRIDELYSYDANGRVTSSSNKVYDANRVIMSRIDKKHFYNKDGSLVQESSATGTFDGRGKLTEFVRIKQKFNSVGQETSYSKRVYDATGNMTSNFSRPARFDVKSDQLASVMNGFGTLNRAPVVATIGQPNRAAVRITMSDSHSPSYEPISYSL